MPGGPAKDKAVLDYPWPKQNLGMHGPDVIQLHQVLNALRHLHR